MEELTENAEEPDDGDSKKEEQKLGKLQYKVGHKHYLRRRYEELIISTNRFVNFRKLFTNPHLFIFHILYIL